MDLFRFTFIIDRTSSSLLISICRASKNFLNVEHVITCVLDVSIPAQLARILDAAIALKIFFCAHCASVNSVSSELFLVKRPEIIEEFFDDDESF